MGGGTEVDDGVKLYTRRWFVLLAFCLTNMYCSIMQMSFSPVQRLAEEYFKQSNGAVQLFAVLYTAVPIVGTWPALYIIKRFGLKLPMIIACSLNLAGAWVKYISTFSGVGQLSTYLGCLAGQLLGAVAQIFALNLISLLAGTWFGPKERVLATSIGTLLGILGQGVAFALGTILNGDYTQFNSMLLIHAIIGTGVFVVHMGMILYAGGKPPHPPSLSSKDRQAAHPLLVELKSMITNPSFLQLVAAFALTYGMLIAFMNLMNQTLTDVNPAWASLAPIVGGIVIGCGAVGCVVISLILDRIQKHKLVVLVCGVCGTAFFCWFIVALHFESQIQIFIALSFGGFFAVPLIPIFYDLAVECVFPVAEANANAMLNLFGQIAGTSFVYVLDALESMTLDSKGKVISKSMEHGMYFCVGCIVVSMGMIIFYKANNARLAMEAGGADGKTPLLEPVNFD